MSQPREWRDAALRVHLSRLRHLLHPLEEACRLLAGRSKKLFKSFQPLRPHGLARRSALKNRKPRNGTWAMTRANRLKIKPRMEKMTDRK